ncbi:hypothetical protein SAMN06264365_11128 [Actinoplanes regularis]|uniref:Uncharacterized protein n=1 Tax=Actinoplanes regularis TaxID=52697 RepID=A0A239C7H7_9ACTN|nr:hypothetical protein Are01nite_87700 [Actinoplanes regularis]SNS16167.1 hypothetical protein SAMN06264365_11128 [Actinoplanes regularis]
MTGWDEEQLAAGFRSMMLLAALVERGGRPAAVSPTVRLRVAEKQYGWFPADVVGDGRRVVVITDQRIVVGDREWPLRALARVDTDPGDWTVTLWMCGRRAPLRLSGPWMPWLGVVLCAELYDAAFEPAEPDAPLRTVGGEPAALPGPRRPSASVDPDLGLERERVAVPQPVHRGDRDPSAAV